MATKPTIANARWADPAEAGKSAPTSGERDSGFVPGNPIVAAIFDYLLNQFYQWAQYLNEGRLDGDSDEGYELNELILSVSDSFYVDFGVTPSMNLSAWLSNTSGDTNVAWPIRLPVGSRIKSITVYGRSGNAAGETIHGLLFTQTPSGHTTASQISTTKESGTADGNDDTVAWTTADTDFTPDGYTIQAGDSLFLLTILGQTSAGSEVAVYGVKVEYDRPV